MKAMILAAGLGTRLRPLTERIPKCMVPVGGKPVLEHTIEWLQRYGVTELMINLHHLPDVVMDHFGDGSDWGVKITYSVEEQSLGTAGGVKNVEWFFDEPAPQPPNTGGLHSPRPPGPPILGGTRASPDDSPQDWGGGGDCPFLVWYGDNLSTCDLNRLYAFHQAKGGVATIALHYREDPTASGIVGLDEDDRITRFLEKPRLDQVFSHWVSAGIFVLEPAVLEAIPAVGAPDFGRDVFPALLAAGQPLYGYRLSADADEGLWWIDTPEDLEHVQSIWTKGGIP